MEKIIGKDDFNGTFNFFEWSAPYYDSELEAARFLTNLDCENKKLIGINVIGKVRRSHRGGSDYDIIRNAGFDVEIDDLWTTYPYLKKIRHPWEVRANEPVQLQFEDGTTLEILPMEQGGARIGCNTIATDIKNGLNNSNFDANHFFSSLIGKELESVNVKKTETLTTTHSRYSISNGRGYTEPRTKYCIEISFEGNGELNLEYDGESLYYITCKDGNYEETISTDRIEASFRASKQIPITNGRTYGGDFWITPDIGEDDEKVFYDRYCISIDEEWISDFLTSFLYRYFDPAVQKDDYYGLTQGEQFDWYGLNYYTTESMRHILDDLKEVSDLLVHDYDNHQLDDVKKGFSVYGLTEKNWKELSDEELNSLRKEVVPYAVDFYGRFGQSIERMMSFPGCKGIYFAGP